TAPAARLSAATRTTWPSASWPTRGAMPQTRSCCLRTWPRFVPRRQPRRCIPQRTWPNGTGSAPEPSTTSGGGPRGASVAGIPRRTSTGRRSMADDLFAAQESAERDARREANLLHSWAMWGWQGPQAGELCDIDIPIPDTPEGGGLYCYTEQARLIEQQPDG